MSIEVWQIGKNVNAEDYYNDIKKAIPFSSETFAVNALASVCEEMINTYDQIIDDQNDNIIDIDSLTNQMDNKNKSIQERIEKLKKEIAALEQKEQDGNISAEELGALTAKKSELNNLLGLTSSSGEKESKEISEKNEKLKKTYRSKEKIATEYGETSVDKGTPLAQTKVKGGFFRKLLGTTGKNKKRAGERAVNAGNELLNKINDSNKVQEDIDKKVKNIAPEK